MKKIGYIITNLGTGGAEMMLLKLLKNLDRSRFEPMVISMMGIADIGPRIAALEIPVYSLGMQRGLLPNPIIFFRLVRLLRRLRPNIVHTWMYHSDLIGGLAARLAACSNVIWGIRHSDLSKNKNKSSTLLVVKMCTWLSRYLPVKILSCSMRAKDIHAAVGYQVDKLHVIPNGFELDRFAPDSSARVSVRKELGLKEDTDLVGLIARYDEQKNHLGFVESVAAVAMQLPEVHFVLVGQDVDEKNSVLQDAIKKNRLQGRIHMLGRRDDVPRLMAALDVLASSSHGEAFPNVLGEAMACGVPCVVTDVGDSAEIVADTGRVVPAGDMAGLARELVAVLQLPAADRVVLGVEARERVAANYEIAHVTRLYEAFYDRVLIDSKGNR